MVFLVRAIGNNLGRIQTCDPINAELYKNIRSDILSQRFVNDNLLYVTVRLNTIKIEAFEFGWAELSPSHYSLW